MAGKCPQVSIGHLDNSSPVEMELTDVEWELWTFPALFVATKSDTWSQKVMFLQTLTKYFLCLNLIGAQAQRLKLKNVTLQPKKMWISNIYWVGKDVAMKQLA